MRQKKRAASGTSAEFWLNLQSLYELRLAEGKTGKAIKKLPTLKHLVPIGPVSSLTLRDRDARLPAHLHHRDRAESLGGRQMMSLDRLI